MAISYKTAQEAGEYTVQFKTSDRFTFQLIDRYCNKLIDRQERKQKPCKEDSHAK